MNKPFIKIQLADFGSEAEKAKKEIVDALDNDFEVCISDDPDILFYNVFGTGVEHLTYKNCIKVFMTQEACYPNYNQCDYAVGKFPVQFEDRYCRINNMDFVKDPSDRSSFEDPAMSRRKFCNFLYNNDQLGYGASVLRPEFCRKLAQYRYVECPGRVLHNIDSEKLSTRSSMDWHETKWGFLADYKFTIAFENASVIGYFTEKLVDPFLAGSIPIYWGDPQITEYFNEKAFINANGKTIEQVIEEVKRIDNDDDLYMEMLLQNPIKDRTLLSEDWREKQATFINKIAKYGTRVTNQDSLFFDVPLQYVYKYQNTMDVKIRDFVRSIKHRMIRK